MTEGEAAAACEHNNQTSANKHKPKTHANALARLPSRTQAACRTVAERMMQPMTDPVNYTGPLQRSEFTAAKSGGSDRHAEVKAKRRLLDTTHS